jgi:hypothetical protein
MTPDELFNKFPPDKWWIWIGGSCVGVIGGTNWDLAYNEIRVLPEPWGAEGNKRSWGFIEESIRLRKRSSINVDQYITSKQHWLPDEVTYKNWVRTICGRILELGRQYDIDARLICEITVDNEPLKDNYHPSVESYIKYVRWCSQVAWLEFGFEVSAGNEEFLLVENRIALGWLDLYEEMVKLYHEGVIQKVAVHLQASRWLYYCKTKETMYGKVRWICTEANYEDPKKTMYSDWIPLIAMALELECEAIGFVFIDYDNSLNPYGTDYSWLTLFDGGVLRVTQQQWLDFRKIAIAYNKEVIMPEYNRPIEQEEFYKAMGWDSKPYHVNTPSLPVVGNKDPNKYITWADFDAVMETLMKGIVKGLKDNGSLPCDFPEPMDIKYNADGSWYNDWIERAKSNPK